MDNCCHVFQVTENLTVVCKVRVTKLYQSTTAQIRRRPLIRKYQRPGFRRGIPNVRNLVVAILGSFIKKKLALFSNNYGMNINPSVFDAYIF